MQTAQLPDEEITAGDTYDTTVVFMGVDYHTYDFLADVRALQRHNAVSLGSFTIDTPSFSGGNTTLLLHLDTDTTRAIGENDGAYWDLQYDDGAGSIRTPIGGRFTVRQDVSEVAP